MILAVEGIPVATAPLEMITDMLATGNDIKLDVARNLYGTMIIFVSFALAQQCHPTETSVDYYLSAEFHTNSYIESRISEALQHKPVYCLYTA